MQRQAILEQEVDGGDQGEERERRGSRSSGGGGDGAAVAAVVAVDGVVRFHGQSGCAGEHRGVANLFHSCTWNMWCLFAGR